MSIFTPTLKPLALLGLIALLGACGDHNHNTVHAVDVVPLAEQNAQAAAPVAEPITFDDEHLPKMSELSDTSTAQTPNDATGGPLDNNADSTDVTESNADTATQ